MTTRLSNTIRGVLTTFGLLPGVERGLRFDRRVEALLIDWPEVALIVPPMLTAWRQLREQIAVFDQAVRVRVRADPTCRLLMSVPCRLCRHHSVGLLRDGIGALWVLAYVSTVEDPERFPRSRAVGAHLGLTPRRYQSGEIDRSGRISRCGDPLARMLMYEAAIVILHRVKRLDSEGRGACHREAIRARQGARGAGPQALGDPAQHLEIGRAFPLVGPRRRIDALATRYVCPERRT